MHFVLLLAVDQSQIGEPAIQTQSFNEEPGIFDSSICPKAVLPCLSLLLFLGGVAFTSLDSFQVLRTPDLIFRLSVVRLSVWRMGGAVWQSLALTHFLYLAK